MDQEQLNRLLDILQKHLKPSDLRTLVFKVLGERAYENLPADTHDERAVAFLEDVGRKQLEKSLLEKLRQLQPDIDLSIFGISSNAESLPTKEPEPTPFINFTNRQVEWERVILYPTGQYYLFDGPAGYGKTALLQKLVEEFKKRNWFYAYVSLETHPTFSEIVTCLADQLQIHCQISADAHESGIEFGKAVVARHVTEGGLAFLFDVNHMPSGKLQATLATLLRDFVTGIWEALTETSGFSRNTLVNYRIVLTGRYLASEIDRLNLPYKVEIIQLKPFDYQVVQDICVSYLKDKLRDSQERAEFAANLLYHTGGHPRCMVRTLQLFEKSRLSPGDFFVRHRDQIKDIAYKEANWVRSSMEPLWRSTFDSLCRFRRFDTELIKQLIEQGTIWKGLGKDAYDVVQNLLQFYLVDRRTDSAYKHLSDDITRRLLVIRLRYDMAPGEFADKCLQARQSCIDRLSIPGELHHVWALEALFSYLQANLERTYQLPDRQVLRQEFFEKECPTIFGLLTKEEPRAECASLKRLLVDDWEFRFTLNYYLRDTVYTDEVYQRLVHYVDQFPAAVKS